MEEEMEEEGRGGRIIHSTRSAQSGPFSFIHCVLYCRMCTSL